MSVALIIPAGGSGSRMTGINESIPKQLHKLLGREIILRTLDTFVLHPEIQLIIISTREDLMPSLNKIISKEDYNNKNTKIIIIKGGATRQESVWNGLSLTELNDYEKVLIHDAVRPFVSRKLISDVISSLDDYEAIVPVVGVNDTIKLIDDYSNYIKNTLERSHLRAAQTPQGFKKDVLINANIYARENNLSVTDDSSIVEYFNKEVKIINGDPENIKITTSLDLKLSEIILKNFQL